MADLARYVEVEEEEEEEEEAEYLCDLRRNQKRTEWSKGKTKTKAEPSENWDDDFLFGALSAESLPLPAKSSDLQPSYHATKKPGSAQSNQHHQHHQTKHHPYKTSEPPPPPPFESTQLVITDQESDSLTPRKPSSRPATIHQSTSTTNTHQPLFRPTQPTTTPSRPPASAPPSRAPSGRHDSPTHIHSPISPHQNQIHRHRHRPPLLLNNSSSDPSHSPSSTSPQAISPKTSLPSNSDLSSAGFRSPSSSLSMTDDGRWDWSHSSGDGGTRFRNAGSGNLSFNTETEFTEPDTELDWAETDHDTHSSRLTLAKHRPRPSLTNITTTSHPHSLSSPFLNRPSSSSLAQPHHRRPPNPNLNPHSNPNPNLSSTSYHATAPSDHHPIPPTTQRNSLEEGHPRSLYAPPTPSTLNSQATSTSSSSSLTSRSRSHYPSDRPVQSPSAASPTSSVGHSLLGCSHGSSLSSDPSYGNQHAYYYFHRSNQDQDPESHLPPQQVRIPSSSSTFSNRLGLYHSGSDSYDAAASGTDTDVASDQCAGDESLQSISSTHLRHNPTVCQRSRKQALYSRPPHVNPSPARSLAASFSSSTLNASEVDANPRTVASHAIDPNNTLLFHRRAGEDEKQMKNPLRRRFRKKRPSNLPLNKATAGLSSGFESPTSAIYRDPSVNESVFTAADDHQPGDLAFAADSEDDERRPRTLRQPIIPTEAFQKLNLARMNLHSRTPTRLNGSSPHPSSGKSPTPVTRSHQTLDMTLPASTLSPPGTTSDEGSGKKFQPRRPLSFTTLFSRGSSGSHTSSLSHHPSSSSIANPPSKNRFAHRHSTSIDSNLHSFTSSPHSQNSNDSLLSRVRRLSSRPPSSKNDFPSGPIRKRFSIVGDNISGMPCLKPASTKTSSGTPTKPNKGINNRFSTALKTNRRQTSQSESVMSDMTLSAPDHQGTVRARRPSSRSSNQSVNNNNNNNSGSNGDVRPRLTLARKFSMRSNNKSSVHQPNLCHSPIDNIDHDLMCTTLVQPVPRLNSKKSLPSRPPKSNPALRAKAEANAHLLDYHSNRGRSIHQKASSPMTSDLDSVSSPVVFRHPFIRNTSNPMPFSEPTPNQDYILERDSQTSNHLTHIGNPSAPLARSNSMGELRIPSRITSQQGRLQTELNQVKEFARGIEELKSMRRSYRKMVRSTHRSRINQNFATTDESDANSFDSDQQKDPEPLPNREPSEEKRLVEPNQISPRALDRLYTIIQKIQEEYKEWWTCCNVLIDLGEGKTDPRAKFSPERIHSITSYSEQPMEQPSSPIPPATVINTETEPRPHKHFEILKSMFGPSGEPPRPVQDLESDDLTSPSPSTPSPEEKEKPIGCQTPPMASTHEVKPCERTPRSRPLVGAENPSRLPSTPSPAPRNASQHERIPRNESTSSIRISDWSESESSWSGIEIGKDEIKSAPAKQQLDGSLGAKVDKEKPRLPRPGQYSSYCSNHHDRFFSFDSVAARPRLSATNRIGISGIKDFLRVLKARVNAEEKWPPRRKLATAKNNNIDSSNTSTMSGVSLKRRSVSSNLHSTVKQSPGLITTDMSKSDQEVKSPPTTMTSLNELDKKGVEPGGGEGSISRENTTESSSEEECWDELFGFKDNSSSLTGTTESLDLALSAGQQPPKKKSINAANAVIGEGGRLALSSERMPQLLSYLSIVKEQCKECLVELKSQTV